LPRCSAGRRGTRVGLGAPLASSSTVTGSTGMPQIGHRPGSALRTEGCRPVRHTVRAPGRAAYDQSLLTDVTLPYPERVGKVFVDRPGQLVRKGERLFSPYGPELHRRAPDAARSARPCRRRPAPCKEKGC
jgi:hypothetical protein